MTNTKQSIGAWGEETACKYLERKGYTIIERNFRQKWGEIDIVASVPRGTLKPIEGLIVPRRTFWSRIRDFFKAPKIDVNKMGNDKPAKTLVFVEVKTLQPGPLRPEDNITPAKMRKLIRSCQLYLAVKKYNPEETDWQIDTIGIVVDKQAGRAKIEHLEQAVYLQ